MSEIAVSVDGLWKNFRLYHERNRFIKAAVLRGRRARYEEFWALRDVSFQIPHGATFGIIGSNGSGKSTMLKCLAGILYPNKGSVQVNGKLAALLELGAGFHYELTGRENIFLNGAILGLSRRELERKYSDIVEFAGLEKFIDTPVKNYSSGMIVRLGFAVAANVEPEILLIDEILSVGDQNFQRRSAEKIEDFRRDGRTIIIVSHGMSQVQQMCKEIAWLDKGELKMLGPASDVIAEYTGVGPVANEANDIDETRRWGTGQATITSVELLDGSRKPIEDLSTGSPLTIAIQFDSHVLIEDMVVFVELSTSTEVKVWSTSTKNNGVSLPRVAGAGRVEIVVAQVNLLEGDYSVSVALRNSRETKEFDHWRDVRNFAVHQRQRFDSGLVALDAQWRM
jgi:ABC-type polysaccharide/polyol phosphate transport system ATPase subunit